MKFHPILFILVVWILFSSPFLFFGKTPFPSNYQVNFFAPAVNYPEMKGPVKNNAQPDIISQIYPWRYFSIQEIKHGRIPLWNPYSFAGTPHLANYQSAVLFPLNFLFFLPISFINAWSILVLIQPLVAGFFAFLLSRKLGVSSIGSVLSAFSFMFCGFMVTWLGYATLGYAILPLPLALYCILQYMEKKKNVWFVLLSATFPLSFFAGHFQTSIYFSLGVLLFIFYQLLISKQRKESIKLMGAFVIGVLLALPQVLPSIELYSFSYRSELFQKMEAIPIQYIATLFSPDFFGNPVTRNDWFGHYAEWSSFAGVVPLAFAIFALLYARSKKTMFFMLLSMTSLLLAFDTPLLNLLVFLKVPVLSTSAAGRIIVLHSFSIAVLAGFGFDAFTKMKQKKVIFLWMTIVSLMFIAFSFVSYLSIQDVEKIKVAQKNSIFPLLTLFSLFLVSAVSVFARKQKLLIISSLVLLFLGGFEMYRFASKWQNFDPKNIVYPQVPITHFYDKLNHYDRAVGLSGAEDAVYYKLPILGGYDPLYKAEYGEFMQYVGLGKLQNPERSVVNFPYQGAFASQALDFFGVRYIVHKVSDGTFSWAFPFKDYPPTQFTKIYDDTRYQVFLNNNSYEKAFVVTSVRTLSHKEIPKVMFENNLKASAFVEKSIGPLDGRASGSAKIISYTPSSVKIEAITSGRSLLVLTDNYYPGWSVKVNGQNEEIYKTNYSFRGVVIPQGKSVIEFSYLPMSFLIGVYMFFIGILSIITIVLVDKFKKTK